MNMLNTVTEPCFPDAPSGDEPTFAGEKPPTAPVESLPVEETPPGPITPTAEAPVAQVPLTTIEKCAGRRHAERVTKALSGMADATPAQVGKVLNDLGYINERIHSLKRAGGATRFFLDLRFMGGSLCLEGSVSGSKTVVEAFGHPETGPFTSAGRKQ